MLPAGFLTRMERLMGAEFSAFLAAYDRPRNVGLRLNPLKTHVPPDLSSFGLSPIRMILVKNPAGCNQVLNFLTNLDGDAVFVICLNDNYADGRDVSWLWDADFELLKDYPNTISVSGIRAYDMAVRMKYAGFAQEKIEVIEDIKEAVFSAIDSINEGEQLLIMPTYTALLEMQKFLKDKK